MARALMLQGTGSDVGKSLLVAGLARAFTRRGFRVRPFKPQNMSNNAAVTADGGEIGRAQALQARACGVAPVTDMNPVLLKPQSEAGRRSWSAAVVWGAASRAREYRRLAPSLLPAVLAPFDRLAETADLVLVEGAGSPAEINLRAGDIANMGFAEAADVPVALIGDIERGGVIAQLVGTLELLSAPSGRCSPAISSTNSAAMSGCSTAASPRSATAPDCACFGVVPYFRSCRAAAGRGFAGAVNAAEMPASARKCGRDERRSQPIKIAVPLLPRIANFDDLDPLRAEPGVEIVMVRAGPAAAARCRADRSCRARRRRSPISPSCAREGWDIDIPGASAARAAGCSGLCGGYQMLGRRIADPRGIEGPPGEAAGLGLLDIDTVLGGDKRLAEARRDRARDRYAGRGYEMHLGTTTGPGLARPMLRSWRP